MADPKGVLKEHGLDVPDGIDVKVVENTDKTVHITLPAPSAVRMSLSDSEISQAAGGEDEYVMNTEFDFALCHGHAAAW